ncbi:hypothetical protein JNW90_35035 [Micromonospora sp. STR1s_5]|nr:hypothetical protein [Micromonospora sp. STR1s_5]
MSSILPGLERNHARASRTQALAETVRTYAQQLADAHAAGKEHSKLSRSYFRALGDLMLRLAIVADENPSAEERKLPFEIAYMLWEHFDMIGVGKIPGPVEASRERGVSSHRPVERKDICCAVAYVVAAKCGDVKDRAHVKTVATAFEVDKRTVQGWVAEYGSLDPSVFCGGQYEELLPRMERAAERYQNSGRSGKAIDRRASKRQGRS